MEGANNTITTQQDEDYGSAVDDNMQEQLKHISSYTSKLFRQKFGRGPELCYASVGHRFLLIQIRGFLSPMEEVLFQHGEEHTIVRSRTIIVETILAELKGVITVTLGLEIDRCFHNWNFRNNTGILVVVFPESVSLGAEVPLEAITTDQDALLEELNRISAIVQKVPDFTAVYPINAKMLVVHRKGILIKIEKALIQNGFHQELRLTKDELEKSHFQRSSRIDQLLKRPVEDIFIDWNFQNDESIVCLMLK